MADQNLDQLVKDLDDTGINYVKAALRWQYNWIGLAGAGAFALLSGSGLPLVLAAGLELMYLAVVPQSSRFRRLVRSWKYAAEKKQRAQRLHELWKELPAASQKRLGLVNQTVFTIKSNYQKLPASSQMFVATTEQKLDSLLQAYLRLLSAAHLQRDYLDRLEPAGVDRELAHLRKDLEKESPKVQEINRKRIDILTRRLEKFQNIRENREVLDAQLEAMEDVLDLIKDQSITMRDPQQVSDQIEQLVEDLEGMEQTVKEVQAIFDLAAPPQHDPLPGIESLASRIKHRSRS